MRAHFEHRLSRVDYITGVESLVTELGRSDPNRKRSNFEQIAMALGVLVIADILFPEAGPAFLLAAVGVLTLSAIFGKRWVRLARGASYDPAAMEVRVEIDGEKLSERSAVRERRWSWEAVRTVHDRGSVVVFSLAGWDMLALPASSWPEAEQKARFLSEVETRLPVGARMVPAAHHPSPEAEMNWTVAALFAAVDAAFGVTLLIPMYTMRFGAMAEDFGMIGAMAILWSIGGLAGYCAFRVAKSVLPKVHAKSSAAAAALALLLMLPLPVWMLAAYLGAI